MLKEDDFPPIYLILVSDHSVLILSEVFLVVNAHVCFVFILFE